ncbi:MAG TPA: HD domain-containing protein [Burkholderiales bacterium]|jgi:phosphonate degradation associated HDIG domain protein
MSRADLTAHQAITELFAARGSLVYGEAITQLQHALQCAALAEASGAAPALIAAALLHDAGHLLHRDAAAAFAASEDDVHEAIGAKYLGLWFGPEVTQPIALHVEAKRYLCRREASYYAGLSSLSQRSLAMQGDAMSEAEARAFEAVPYALDAVQVRRWDDTGKERGAATPDLAHFLALVAPCATGGRDTA